MRSLWAIAFVVRYTALIVGVRWRAPRAWIQWAACSLLIGLALWFLDHQRAGLYYARLWMVDQVVVTGLLGVLFWAEIHPDGATVAFSGLGPLAVGAVFIGPMRWPSSVFEPVIWVTSLFTLWMGVAAAVKTAAVPSGRKAVLSFYLLMSALLVLVIPSYVGGDGVSRGACALDIVAYSAWAIVWRRGRRGWMGRR